MVGFSGRQNCSTMTDMNLDQIAAVGRRRKKLEQQFDKATEELRQLCRESNETIADIAEAAQVPRMTVYRWLNR